MSNNSCIEIQIKSITGGKKARILGFKARQLGLKFTCFPTQYYNNVNRIN